MCLEQALHDSIEALFRKSTYSADNRDLTRPFYVHFTTPRPTKGLEFDVVIAAYFDEYDWQDAIQANAAYVAISRPRKVLHIIGGNLQSGPLWEIMR
jgi:superfamily I DNA/RNA helicase